MIAASWFESDPRGERLLVVARGEIRHARVSDLASRLDEGDLVVVNDSASLPASFAATIGTLPLELRLARRGRDAHEWSALVFGPGDWRTRTEDRPAPPPLERGSTLRIGPDLVAVVLRVHPEWKGRLIDVRLEAAGASDGEFWASIYRHGRPVQYAHVARPLRIWDVQNVFAGPPWSVEFPSAGRVLRAHDLESLRARGVTVAALTHAAGLSSTGVAALDERLPLPERSFIPESTVMAIAQARSRGRRVVAVGTTVLRALEGRAALAGAGGELRAGEAETDLIVTRKHERRIVTSLLTGIHEDGTSHHRVLEAFLDRATLDRALCTADRARYRTHELGDAMLIL